MSESKHPNAAPNMGAVSGVGGASPANVSSPALIITASDDWSHDDFTINSSIIVTRDPDKAYYKCVEEIREAWGDNVIDDFEVDLKVDLWVAETAEKLGLGEVARAHLFVITSEKGKDEEDAMNLLVFLTYP